MSTFSHRLKEFMQQEGLNQTELAKKLGYKSTEKISRLLRNEDASPSVDIIIDFSNTFEKLNIEWLVTGKGEIDRQVTMNELLKETNEMLKTMVKLLEARIKRLEKQIVSLGYKPID